MKRILIFSTAYFPFVGGAEIAVKEITDRFDAANYEFIMITARLNRKLPSFEKIGNISVNRIGIGWPVFDKYFLAFCGHCEAQKMNTNFHFDLVWSIMASYGGFTARFFKKKNPNIPFLLTLQEGDDIGYIKKRVGWLRGIFRDIFAKADYIQCISKFLATWAGDNGAKCPVKVVPNGVDINKLKVESLKLKVKEIKDELNIKENEKIVITTSRLVKKNGVGDLIEAMQYLPKNIILLVIGTGELINNYELQITNYKLNDRVLMLGLKQPKEIPEYLAIADVFVRPSLSEGLGNSFLEAMAANVPIIGTRVGGIPDFLIDGVTGLFCEVNSPRSIAEKINILLNDVELRQTLIVNGRKLVEEKYSWQIVSEQMKMIFDKLIK